MKQILFFDIENGPMTTFNWKTRADYIGHYMVKEPNYMLVWGARWRGQKRIHQGVVTPTEARNGDDRRIIEDLANLIREADMVIGHNVDKHDLAITRGRVLVHGLEPLPPTRSIDTLKIAKRDFGLHYNGMEPLCELAGIETGKKIGMARWRKALAGDKASLDALKEYNKGDVIASEKLFDWMLPHAQRISRLVDGPGFSCPFCGNSTLIKRGFYRTQVSTFQRWQCTTCNKYSRSKSLVEKRLPVHPL